MSPAKKSFLLHIKSKRYEIILGLITSTVGLLLALLINSAVGYWNDGKTYASMLAAIESEAEYNQKVLDESFKPLFRDGVVLREFSLTTVSQPMANPLFVAHAKQSDIEILNAYMRNLRLANAYRERSERIRFNESLEPWSEGLTEKGEENLRACEESIEMVRKISK